MIDRLSRTMKQNPTPEKVKPTLRLALRLNYTERVWISIYSILFLVLASLLCSALIGIGGWLLLGVVGPVGLTFFWIITSRSVLEVSSDGIMRRYWDGTGQWLPWSEVAYVEHNDFTGTVTLFDFSRKTRIQFNHNRLHLRYITTILTHRCPHLWRYEIQRTFSTHPMKWVYSLLMLIPAFGLIYMVALKSPMIAIVTSVVLGMGMVWILWNYPTHLVITKNALVVKSPRRTAEYPFTDIRDIEFISNVRQDRSTTYSVTVLLEGKNWQTLNLSGFHGGTISLYCTLRRALLDYRRW
jgi:hypothetical protein